MGSLALNAGKEGCTCTQFIEVSMASQLSGPNIEEEYLWSVTLDDKTKQFSWSPNDPSDEVKDDDDENFKPNHRLLIKTAILHPDSAKDEVTMLEIETNGYKKEKVKAPFLAMKSGLQLQQYVDILLPDTATIKITLARVLSHWWDHIVLTTMITGTMVVTRKMMMKSAVKMMRWMKRNRKLQPRRILPKIKMARKLQRKKKLPRRRKRQR